MCNEHLLACITVAKPMTRVYAFLLLVVGGAKSGGDWVIKTPSQSGGCGTRFRKIYNNYCVILLKFDRFARKNCSGSEFSRRPESRRVFPRGRKPGEAFRIRSFLDGLSSLGGSRCSTFQEVGIREGFPTRPDSGRGSDREPESR